MKYVLLKMNLCGIKNIDKEIELNFYKSSINSGFDNSNSHVKAIYGTNGTGKTAIMYAINMYKNIMMKYSYLRMANLKDLINQILQRFYIKFCFAAVNDEKIQSIYEHSIEIKSDNGSCVITKESFYELKGQNINKASKKKIYDVINGELTINESYKYSDQIKIKTLNLLSSQPLLLTLSETDKNDMKIDEKLSHKLKDLLEFVNDVYVLLQDTDTNKIKFHSVIQEMSLIIDMQNHSTPDDFTQKILYNQLYKNNTDTVHKENYSEYEKYITKLAKFIRIFKEDLLEIKIEKEENKDFYECKNIMIYKDGKKIDKKYESTGIKKIIDIYGALCAIEKGKIVFIDEFDANIHDVLLIKLIEYIINYSKGQFIFTTHNLGPMEVLKNHKHSIDFLSPDSRITSWKNNGNYTPASLYRKGLIEYSPFNLEPFSFLGAFGENN